jgi:hypothetical protein
MHHAEIDLKVLKRAVNDILDHLIQDLGLEKIEIDGKEDFYWECPVPEVYDMSTEPEQLDSGRLSDDINFVTLVHRGQNADVSYNLVHIAPLLRYIAEKVKR